MLGWSRSGQNRPVRRGAHGARITAVVQAVRSRTALFCFWRMICKCSSWFPSRLACYHCARCPQPRLHLGVPINPMGALIAATIRGSNARRALTAMTVVPVILGTAKQGIEGSAADNRPQDHAGADALIPPARYPGLDRWCRARPLEKALQHASPYLMEPQNSRPPGACEAMLGHVAIGRHMARNRPRRQRRATAAHGRGCHERIASTIRGTLSWICAPITKQAS